MSNFVVTEKSDKNLKISTNWLQQGKRINGKNMYQKLLKTFYRV